jgi:hypothetical protein
MRRVLAPLLAALLLLISVVPVLAGGKPEFAKNEPAAPQFFAADALCNFAVRIDVLVDTGHSIAFPEADDGSARVLLGGHLVLLITNEETDASVTYNASGPGKFVFQGDRLSITGSGPWLLYPLVGDATGPGIWYTKGPVALEVDLTDGHWISASLTGNAVDVCAALGGAGGGQ